jgi:exosortase E/protease (VPEID-CTERM system)
VSQLSSYTAIRGAFSHPLLWRFLCAGSLLGIELLIVSVWLDTGALSGRGGLTAAAGYAGPWTVRGLVVFVVFGFAVIAGTGNQTLKDVSTDGVPVSSGFLSAHFVSLLVSLGLAGSLFGGKASGLRSDLLAGTWIATGLFAAGAAACAFVPPAVWIRLMASYRRLLPVVAALAALACVLGTGAQALWESSAKLTLLAVGLLFKPLLRGFFIDVAADRLVGTTRFSVQIAPGCSGLEGVALFLTFAGMWLWWFRREYRFPQALVLLPLGAMVSWLLNVVRIGTLIAIGDAGAPGIALGGFHSQAGWIAFNFVAVGFAAMAGRIPWIQAQPRSSATRFEYPAVPFLLPFVGILLAGMISRAASGGGFEWLYPLRFFAAGAILYRFRSQYAKLRWRCGWTGPLIGLTVFLIWMALERTGGSAPPPPELLTATGWATGWTAGLWVLFRVLGSVVTVPIAEELAFRVFMIRRLQTADFEGISLTTFTYSTVLISSVAFGLMHGDRWFGGAIAGGLFAFALLRRGSVGDAVVAHAVCNLAIAGLVLFRGYWGLW